MNKNVKVFGEWIAENWYEGAADQMGAPVENDGRLLYELIGAIVAEDDTDAGIAAFETAVETLIARSETFREYLMGKIEAASPRAERPNDSDGWDSGSGY
jgi:hypothetical protein